MLTSTYFAFFWQAHQLKLVPLWNERFFWKEENPENQPQRSSR